MKKKVMQFFVYLVLTLLMLACDLLKELTEDEIEEDPVSYTVTFDKGDPEATGIMEPILVSSTFDAPLCLFERPGYTFSYWNTESNGNFVNQISISRNITLYAEWEQIIHTISFDKNLSSATGDMVERTAGEGTTFQLPVSGFSLSDNKFMGWALTVDGDVEFEGNEEITIGDSDIVLYAVWKKIDFTYNSLGYTLAYTYDDGGYRVYDGGYAVSSCDDNVTGDIIVPAEINGFTVTAIGSSAFSGCQYLDSIELPDTITSIGASAFYSCESLTNVVIPSSVTIIQNDVFRDCSNLKEITILGDIISIGARTFANCRSLTSIILPNSVISIGNSAFGNCRSLTNLILPNSVISIGNSAFEDCYSLTNMTIPENVTSIGDSAFENCNSLTNVIISDALQILSKGIFRGCSVLETVNIPSGLTTIEEEVFYNCTLLEGIFIPLSVTLIGQKAFYNCDELTTIIIPEGILHIYDSTFANCDNLTNVSFPSSLTEIEKSAFHECSGFIYTMLPDNFFTKYPNLNKNDFARVVTFDNQSADSEQSVGSLNISGGYNYASYYDFPSNPEKDGYAFGGWFTQTNGEGFEYSLSSSYYVTENITIYAHWVGNSRTITFNDKGATTEPSFTSITVIYPQISIHSLPTPPDKTGYTFDGWFTESDGNGLEFTVNTTVSADNTVYAFWRPDYVILFDDDNIATATIFAYDTVAYSQTSIDSLPTKPEKTGHTFDGWFTGYNGGGSEFTADVIVTTDVRVYAYWRPDYIIIFNDRSATIEPSFATTTVIYPQTSIDSLPTPPEKIGYTFDGWFTSTNGNGIELKDETIVSASDTVYAFWRRDYIISFDDRGATTEPSFTSITVIYPQTSIDSLPTPPEKTGYIFDGWFTSSMGEGIELTDETIISVNDTVYANWRPDYIISFDDRGATTEPSFMSTTVIYPQTSIDFLPIPPERIGYTFDGWFTSIYGNGSELTADTIVSTNYTVYSFWRSDYIISFDDKSATIGPSFTSATVVYPQTFIDSLPTPPEKIGYTFDGWFTSYMGRGIELTDETIVSENDTVYAFWRSDYIISFNDVFATTEPSFLSTTIVYPQTSIDSLPTPPERIGFTFEGWFTDSNGGGTEFSDETIVFANDTVYAYWNAAPVVDTIGQTYNNENLLPTRVWAYITDGNGLSDIVSVVAEQRCTDYSDIFTYTLYDDGTHGDATAGDGIFEYIFVNDQDQRYYTSNEGHKWTITATDSKEATGIDSW